MTGSASVVQGHGDTIWGIVVGSLVTILVGLFFYLRQRQTKALEWRSMQDRSLMPFTTLGADRRLRMLAGEVELNDPRWLIIRFENTGRTEIPKDDYEVPITLTFDARVAYVDGQVSETSSRGVNPVLNRPDPHTEDQSWRVTPTLLNPGEWFDLVFIVDGPKGHPRITARVAGIKELHRARSQETATERLLRWFIDYPATLRAVALGAALLGLAVALGVLRH